MLGRIFQALSGMLAAARAPRLFYEENGRDGRIRYQQGTSGFDMYWAFGGGDVLVTIDVPEIREWESATGLPLADRETVLDFIARQIIRDKTSSGRNRFEIGRDSITIYM